MKSYIIFSVYQATEEPLYNVAKHKKVRGQLDFAMIPYRELEGSYSGIVERSFLIPNTNENKHIVSVLMSDYNQECYLRIDEHRHGMYKVYFVHKYGKETFQGYLRTINKEIVNKLNLDYSYYRENPNQVWTIWHSDTCMLDKLEAEIEKELYAKAG